MPAAAKKDEGVDIALVLGGGDGPKGGKPPKKPMPSMMAPEDEGEGGEGDELPPGFADAAEEALDASLPPEQRARALKTAINLCREADY